MDPQKSNAESLPGSDDDSDSVECYNAVNSALASGIGPEQGYDALVGSTLDSILEHSVYSKIPQFLNGRANFSFDEKEKTDVKETLQKPNDRPAHNSPKREIIDADSLPWIFVEPQETVLNNSDIIQNEVLASKVVKSKCIPEQRSPEEVFKAPSQKDISTKDFYELQGKKLANEFLEEQIEISIIPQKENIILENSVTNNKEEYEELFDNKQSDKMHEAFKEEKQPGLSMPSLTDSDDEIPVLSPQNIEVVSNKECMPVLTRNEDEIPPKIENKKLKSANRIKAEDKVYVPTKAQLKQYGCSDGIFNDKVNTESFESNQSVYNILESKENEHRFKGKERIVFQENRKEVFSKNLIGHNESDKDEVDEILIQEQPQISFRLDGNVRNEIEEFSDKFVLPSLLKPLELNNGKNSVIEALCSKNENKEILIEEFYEVEGDVNIEELPYHYLISEKTLNDPSLERKDLTEAPVANEIEVQAEELCKNNTEEVNIGKNRTEDAVNNENEIQVEVCKNETEINVANNEENSTKTQVLNDIEVRVQEFCQNKSEIDKVKHLFFDEENLTKPQVNVIDDQEEELCKNKTVIDKTKIEFYDEEKPNEASLISEIEIQVKELCKNKTDEDEFFNKGNSKQAVVINENVQLQAEEEPYKVKTEINKEKNKFSDIEKSSKVSVINEIEVPVEQLCKNKTQIYKMEDVLSNKTYNKDKSTETIINEIEFQVELYKNKTEFNNQEHVFLDNMNSIEALGINNMDVQVEELCKNIPESDKLGDELNSETDDKEKSTETVVNEFEVQAGELYKNKTEVNNAEDLFFHKNNSKKGSVINEVEVKVKELCTNTPEIDKVENIFFDNMNSTEDSVINEIGVQEELCRNKIRIDKVEDILNKKIIDKAPSSEALDYIQAEELPKNEIEINKPNKVNDTKALIITEVQAQQGELSKNKPEIDKVEEIFLDKDNSIAATVINEVHVEELCTNKTETDEMENVLKSKTNDKDEPTEAVINESEVQGEELSKIETENDKSDVFIGKPFTLENSTETSVINAISTQGEGICTSNTTKIKDAFLNKTNDKINMVKSGHVYKGSTKSTKKDAIVEKNLQFDKETMKVSIINIEELAKGINKNIHELTKTKGIIVDNNASELEMIIPVEKNAAVKKQNSKIVSVNAHLIQPLTNLQDLSHKKASVKYFKDVSLTKVPNRKSKDQLEVSKSKRLATLAKQGSFQNVISKEGNYNGNSTKPIIQVSKNAIQTSQLRFLENQNNHFPRFIYKDQQSIIPDNVLTLNFLNTNKENNSVTAKLEYMNKTSMSCQNLEGDPKQIIYGEKGSFSFDLSQSDGFVFCCSLLQQVCDLHNEVMFTSSIKDKKDNEIAKTSENKFTNSIKVSNNIDHGKVNQRTEDVTDLPNNNFQGKKLIHELLPKDIEIIPLNNQSVNSVNNRPFLITKHPKESFPIKENPLPTQVDLIMASLKKKQSLSTTKLKSWGSQNIVSESNAICLSKEDACRNKVEERPTSLNKIISNYRELSDSFNEEEIIPLENCVTILKECNDNCDRVITDGSGKCVTSSKTNNSTIEKNNKSKMVNSLQNWNKNGISASNSETNWWNNQVKIKPHGKRMISNIAENPMKKNKSVENYHSIKEPLETTLIYKNVMTDRDNQGVPVDYSVKTYKQHVNKSSPDKSQEEKVRNLEKIAKFIENRQLKQEGIQNGDCLKLENNTQPKNKILHTVEKILSLSPKGNNISKIGVKLENEKQLGEEKQFQAVSVIKSQETASILQKVDIPSEIESFYQTEFNYAHKTIVDEVSTELDSKIIGDVVNEIVIKASDIEVNEENTQIHNITESYEDSIDYNNIGGEIETVRIDDPIEAKEVIVETENKIDESSKTTSTVNYSTIEIVKEETSQLDYDSSIHIDSRETQVLNYTPVEIQLSEEKNDLFPSKIEAITQHQNAINIEEIALEQNRDYLNVTDCIPEKNESHYTKGSSSNQFFIPNSSAENSAPAEKDSLNLQPNIARSDTILSSAFDQCFQQMNGLICPDDNSQLSYILHKKTKKFLPYPKNPQQTQEMNTSNTFFSGPVIDSKSLTSSKGKSQPSSKGKKSRVVKKRNVSSLRKSPRIRTSPVKKDTVGSGNTLPENISPLDGQECLERNKEIDGSNSSDYENLSLSQRILFANSTEKVKQLKVKETKKISRNTPQFKSQNIAGKNCLEKLPKKGCKKDRRKSCNRVKENLSETVSADIEQISTDQCTTPVGCSNILPTDNTSSQSKELQNVIDSLVHSEVFCEIKQRSDVRNSNKGLKKFGKNKNPTKTAHGPDSKHHQTPNTKSGNLVKLKAKLKVGHADNSPLISNVFHNVLTNEAIFKKQQRSQEKPTLNIKKCKLKEISFLSETPFIAPTKQLKGKTPARKKLNERFQSKDTYKNESRKRKGAIIYTSPISSKNVEELNQTQSMFVGSSSEEKRTSRTNKNKEVIPLAKKSQHSKFMQEIPVPILDITPPKVNKSNTNKTNEYKSSNNNLRKKEQEEKERTKPLDSIKSIVPKDTKNKLPLRKLNANCRKSQEDIPTIILSDSSDEEENLISNKTCLKVPSKSVSAGPTTRSRNNFLSETQNEKPSMNDIKSPVATGKIENISSTPSPTIVKQVNKPIGSQKRKLLKGRRRSDCTKFDSVLDINFPPGKINQEDDPYIFTDSDDQQFDDTTSPKGTLRAIRQSNQQAQRSCLRNSKYTFEIVKSVENRVEIINLTPITLNSVKSPKSNRNDSNFETPKSSRFSERRVVSQKMKPALINRFNISDVDSNKLSQSLKTIKTNPPLDSKSHQENLEKFNKCDVMTGSSLISSKNKWSVAVSDDSNHLKSSKMEEMTKDNKILTNSVFQLSHDKPHGAHESNIVEPNKATDVVLNKIELHKTQPIKNNPHHETNIAAELTPGLNPLNAINENAITLEQNYKDKQNINTHYLRSKTTLDKLQKCKTDISIDDHSVSINVENKRKSFRNKKEMSKKKNSCGMEDENLTMFKCSPFSPKVKSNAPVDDLIQKTTLQDQPDEEKSITNLEIQPCFENCDHVVNKSPSLASNNEELKTDSEIGEISKNRSTSLDSEKPNPSSKNEEIFYDSLFLIAEVSTQLKACLEIAQSTKLNISNNEMDGHSSLNTSEIDLFKKYSLLNSCELKTVQTEENKPRDLEIPKCGTMHTENNTCKLIPITGETIHYVENSPLEVKTIDPEIIEDNEAKFSKLKGRNADPLRENCAAELQLQDSKIAQHVENAFSETTHTGEDISDSETLQPGNSILLSESIPSKTIPPVEKIHLEQTRDSKNIGNVKINHTEVKARNSDIVEESENTSAGLKQNNSPTVQHTESIPSKVKSSDSEDKEHLHIAMDSVPVQYVESTSSELITTLETMQQRKNDSLEVKLALCDSETFERIPSEVESTGSKDIEHIKCVSLGTTSDPETIRYIESTSSKFIAKTSKTIQKIRDTSLEAKASDSETFERTISKINACDYKTVEVVQSPSLELGSDLKPVQHFETNSLEVKVNDSANYERTCSELKAKFKPMERDMGIDVETMHYVENTPSEQKSSNTCITQHVDVLPSEVKDTIQLCNRIPSEIKHKDSQTVQHTESTPLEMKSSYSEIIENFVSTATKESTSFPKTTEHLSKSNSLDETERNSKNISYFESTHSETKQSDPKTVQNGEIILPEQKEFDSTTIPLGKKTTSIEGNTIDSNSIGYVVTTLLEAAALSNSKNEEIVATDSGIIHHGTPPVLITRTSKTVQCNERATSEVKTTDKDTIQLTECAIQELKQIDSEVVKHVESTLLEMKTNDSENIKSSPTKLKLRDPETIHCVESTLLDTKIEESENMEHIKSDPLELTPRNPKSEHAEITLIDVKSDSENIKYFETIHSELVSTGSGTIHVGSTSLEPKMIGSEIYGKYNNIIPEQTTNLDGETTTTEPKETNLESNQLGENTLKSDCQIIQHFEQGRSILLNKKTTDSEYDDNIHSELIAPNTETIQHVESYLSELKETNSESVQQLESNPPLLKIREPETIQNCFNQHESNRIGTQTSEGEDITISEMDAKNSEIIQIENTILELEGQGLKTIEHSVSTSSETTEDAQNLEIYDQVGNVLNELVNIISNAQTTLQIPNTMQVTENKQLSLQEKFSHTDDLNHSTVFDNKGALLFNQSKTSLTIECVNNNICCDYKYPSDSVQIAKDILESVLINVDQEVNSAKGNSSKHEIKQLEDAESKAVNDYEKETPRDMTKKEINYFKENENNKVLSNKSEISRVEKIFQEPNYNYSEVPKTQTNEMKTNFKTVPLSLSYNHPSQDYFEDDKFQLQETNVTEVNTQTQNHEIIQNLSKTFLQNHNNKIYEDNNKLKGHFEIEAINNNKGRCLQGQVELSKCSENCQYDKRKNKVQTVYSQIVNNKIKEPTISICKDESKNNLKETRRSIFQETEDKAQFDVEDITKACQQYVSILMHNKKERHLLDVTGSLKKQLHMKPVVLVERLANTTLKQSIPTYSSKSSAQEPNAEIKSNIKNNIFKNNNLVKVDPSQSVGSSQIRKFPIGIKTRRRQQNQIIAQEFKTANEVSAKQDRRRIRPSIKTIESSNVQPDSKHHRKFHPLKDFFLNLKNSHDMNKKNQNTTTSNQKILNKELKINLEVLPPQRDQFESFLLNHNVSNVQELCSQLQDKLAPRFISTNLKYELFKYRNHSVLTRPTSPIPPTSMLPAEKYIQLFKEVNFNPNLEKENLFGEHTTPRSEIIFNIFKNTQQPLVDEQKKQGYKAHDRDQRHVRSRSVPRDSNFYSTTNLNTFWPRGCSSIKKGEQCLRKYHSGEELCFCDKKRTWKIPSYNKFNLQDNSNVSIHSLPETENFNSDTEQQLDIEKKITRKRGRPRKADQTKEQMFIKAPPNKTRSKSVEPVMFGKHHTKSTSSNKCNMRLGETKSHLDDHNVSNVDEILNNLQDLISKKSSLLSKLLPRPVMKQTEFNGGNVNTPMNTPFQSEIIQGKRKRGRPRKTNNLRGENEVIPQCVQRPRTRSSSRSYQEINLETTPIPNIDFSSSRELNKNIEPQKSNVFPKRGQIEFIGLNPIRANSETVPFMATNINSSEKCYASSDDSSDGDAILEDQKFSKQKNFQTRGRPRQRVLSSLHKNSTVSDRSTHQRRQRSLSRSSWHFLSDESLVDSSSECDDHPEEHGKRGLYKCVSSSCSRLPAATTIENYNMYDFKEGKRIFSDFCQKIHNSKIEVNEDSNCENSTMHSSYLLEKICSDQSENPGGTELKKRGRPRKLYMNSDERERKRMNHQQNQYLPFNNHDLEDLEMLIPEDRETSYSHRNKQMVRQENRRIRTRSLSRGTRSSTSISILIHSDDENMPEREYNINNPLMDDILREGVSTGINGSLLDASNQCPQSQNILEPSHQKKARSSSKPEVSMQSVSTIERRTKIRPAETEDKKRGRPRKRNINREENDSRSMNYQQNQLSPINHDLKDLEIRIPEDRDTSHSDRNKQMDRQENRRIRTRSLSRGTRSSTGISILIHSDNENISEREYDINNPLMDDVLREGLSKDINRSLLDALNQGSQSQKILEASHRRRTRSSSRPAMSRQSVSSEEEIPPKEQTLPSVETTQARKRNRCNGHNTDELPSKRTLTEDEHGPPKKEAVHSIVNFQNNQSNISQLPSISLLQDSKSKDGPTVHQLRRPSPFQEKFPPSNLLFFNPYSCYQPNGPMENERSSNEDTPQIYGKASSSWKYSNHNANDILYPRKKRKMVHQGHESWKKKKIKR